MTPPDNVIPFPRRHRNAWSDLELVEGALEAVLDRLRHARGPDDETRRFARDNLRLVVDWLEE